MSVMTGVLQVSRDEAAFGQPDVGHEQTDDVPGAPVRFRRVRLPADERARPWLALDQSLRRQRLQRLPNGAVAGVPLLSQLLRRTEPVAGLQLAATNGPPDELFQLGGSAA